MGKYYVGSIGTCDELSTSAVYSSRELNASQSMMRVTALIVGTARQARLEHVVGTQHCTTVWARVTYTTV